jgi:hypothetical protein
MSPGVRPGRVGTAFVTAGTFAVLFACGGPLLQVELDCEEAVSVLDGCCPGFAGSQLQCNYKSDCSGTTYPAISQSDSACIRSESCSELKSTGVCDRAQKARSYSTGGVSDCPLGDASCNTMNSQASVCP